MGERILLVDDDEGTIWLVSRILQRAGFEVFEALTAEEGLRLAQANRPHLVLLDVMMPAMDGWEVCRRLREISAMPIIFLTARTAIRDVVHGLELGADDYIVKPFNNDELVARVKAHLRRAESNGITEEVVLDNGNFRINFLNRMVEVQGKAVDLTRKEFELLATLVRNSGRVLTRNELITQAWGPEYADAFESLKLYVHYLRRKIEKDPEQPIYILTSRGVGYRFADRA